MSAAAFFPGVIASGFRFVVTGGGGGAGTLPGIIFLTGAGPFKTLGGSVTTALGSPIAEVAFTIIAGFAGGVVADIPGVGSGGLAGTPAPPSGMPPVFSAVIAC